MGISTKDIEYFIVTEYMSKGSLFDLMYKNNEKIPWNIAHKIAIETAKGMNYLHNRCILTRKLFEKKST